MDNYFLKSSSRQYWKKSFFSHSGFKGYGQTCHSMDISFQFNLFHHCREENFQGQMGKTLQCNDPAAFCIRQLLLFIEAKLPECEKAVEEGGGSVQWDHTPQARWLHNDVELTKAELKLQGEMLESTLEYFSLVSEDRCCWWVTNPSLQPLKRSDSLIGSWLLNLKSGLWVNKSWVRGHILRGSTSPPPFILLLAVPLHYSRWCWASPRHSGAASSSSSWPARSPGFRLRSDWRAKSAASLFKLCPQASFNIQQTFDRHVTCDGQAECQTTAETSSRGGENSTLCLGGRRLRGRRRGTPGRRCSAIRKWDIHQCLSHFILFFLILAKDLFFKKKTKKNNDIYPLGHLKPPSEFASRGRKS